ncbi:MAG: ABC transporter ATP-binding protein [Candidatus Anammoximicrobium sp.]|nr:ABC transporter ATP-binding protein [Candidatus Anammoximicrobium sp.]
MPVIEAAGLKKTYHTGEVDVEVLRGVDLEVERGEFVAIMGPSGSGKSTLLHLLGGIDVPTSGRVMLDGEDLSNLGDDGRTLLRRRRLGFIFQTFNLLPTLTAEENVALPLELDGVPSSEARQRARTMLDQVGMTHRRQHVPGKLSGGEQQRVGVARALAIEPLVLLADEPTGNLDSANGRQVTALLRGLVDELQQTIVMVTHDAAVAASADRLVQLRDGLVVRSDCQEPGGGAAAAAGREERGG